MRLNQWEISAAPKKYRLRMGWWWLTPGQQVSSLVMGRHPACADQVLYHRHPSRYTVATVDWLQGPDSHSKPRYLVGPSTWMGSGLTSGAGYTALLETVGMCSAKRWHITGLRWSIRATETAFHPDSSRMVDQGSSTGHKVPFSTALVSPCTADSVGPAAPGVVQWRNTICSSSVLYSGQAPNGASQCGSCNFVWDQMILVKHCRDEAGGSNVRISGAGSGFGHKAAGRCLECQVQAYCSLWVKSISVTADSVGSAAP